MKHVHWIYFALFFGFFLGISNGYITLWKDGVEKPAQVFPYRVQMLPDADKQALESGIRINTQEHLQQLLEDYLS